MAEFIEILSDSALKEVETLNKRLLETVENIDKINAKSKNMLTPSGANSAVKDLTNQYKEQEKTIASLQAKLEKATAQNTKNIERQRLAEIKLAQDREKAFDKFDKQAQKEQARAEASVNIYNKVQAKLNALSNEYKALATRRELGLTLTSKEEQRYNSLQGRIQNYDKALKAVDASMGKHQRNVGNYAGAFNPLTNSIVQLEREMPAFANSVQTGFMAISNNLPMFFDAFQQAIDQNKALQAQGKPTTSVLKQMASSLFSFQSLLSIGVTLLTIYGKDIVEAFAGGSEILDKQKEAMQSVASTTTETAQKLKVVKEVLNTTNVSQKQYNEALRIAKENGISLNAIEQARKGNLELINKELERAILVEVKRAQAQMLVSRLAELEIQTNQKRAQAVKDLGSSWKNTLLSMGSVGMTIRNFLNERDVKNVKDLNTSYEETQEELKKVLEFLKEDDKGTAKRVSNKKKEKKAVEDLKFGTEAWLQSEINKTEELRSKVATNTLAYREYSGAIAYYTKWLETLTGVTRKNNEEEEKKKELLYGTIPYYEKLQEEIKALQLLVTDTSGEEYARLQRQIDFYQVLINAIKGVKEETKKAKEENIDWGNYIKGFKDDFFQKAGFDKLQFLIENFEDLKGSGEATALAISEAFQQTFNTLSEMSGKNYQVAFENLERQKNISIQFAGDSATARENIERQYEDKRRKLELEKAKQQKKLAIFNATIDMAQGIIGAWANPGYPMAIPLTALIAGLGAAQIAAISNQQIPNYEKGTEYHKGGLMLVNDAKGSNYQETVITPNGKVFKPQGRNVLMNAPKGTKVKTAEWTENLNNILLSNGINGVSQGNTTINPIVNVETKDNYHFEVNESGFKTFIKRGQAKTEVLNGRFRQQKRNY